jgi:chloramphenicol 3-O-phosphotransferase
MLLSFHFGNRDNLSVLVLDVVRLLAGRRVLPLGVAGKCNQTAVRRRARNPRNGGDARWSHIPRKRNAIEQYSLESGRKVGPTQLGSMMS